MNTSSLFRVIRDAWRIAIGTPSLWFYALVASAVVWYNAWTGAFRGVWILTQFKDFGDQLLTPYRENALQTILTQPLADQLLNTSTKPIVISIAAILIALFIFVVVTAQLYLLELIDSESGAAVFSKKRHLKHPIIHPALGSTLITHLLFRFVSILLFMVAALPVALAAANYSNALLILSIVIFFLLFLPLAMIVEAWKNLAIVDQVVDRQSLHKSLRTAWLQVKSYWLIHLEIGVVLIAARFALLTLILLVAGILAAPTAVGIMIFINSGMYIIASIIIFLLVVAVTTAIFLLVAIYTAFDQSMWLLMYKRMTTDNPLTRTLSALELIVEHGIIGLHHTHRLYKKGKNALAMESVDETENARKLINDFITMLKKKTQASKTTIESIEKELRKYVKKGEKNLIPKLEKAMKDLEKKYIEYKPQIDKAVASGIKQIKKETPKVKRWIGKGARKVLEMTGETTKKTSNKKRK